MLNPRFSMIKSFEKKSARLNIVRRSENIGVVGAGFKPAPTSEVDMMASSSSAGGALTGIEETTTELRSSL